MERTITKIDAIPKLELKKRVAAYARVSSGKDSMLHSLAQQVNYYKHLIQSNDAWRLLGYMQMKHTLGLRTQELNFKHY